MSQDGQEAGGGRIGPFPGPSADEGPRQDGPDPGDAFLEVFGLSLFEPTKEKALARYRNYAREPAIAVLVHRAGAAAGNGQEGRIDGCIAYRREVGSLEILNIGVGPASRKQGVGRRLVEAVIRLEGPRRAWLETDNDAVGFYRSCGFVVKSLGEKYPGIERFECSRTGDGPKPS